MNKRPILVLLASSWISMLGAALVTLAGFSWLFVLPLNISGHVGNPYIGLLVFIAIPAIFFAGLVLIPIGIALANRKVVESLNEVEDRRLAWRPTTPSGRGLCGVSYRPRSYRLVQS